jgi:hypothetical protein
MALFSIWSLYKPINSTLPVETETINLDSTFYIPIGLIFLMCCCIIIISELFHRYGFLCVELSAQETVIVTIQAI